MKLFFLFFFALLVYTSGFPQEPPIKYGTLSENEINLNNYGLFPAVILCDYGNYYFDNRGSNVFLIYSRHLRIKILSAEGLNYATQVIKFYDLTRATSYPYSNAYDLQAQTLNVDNKGNIIKSKVKFENININRNLTDYNTELTLNFPDVREGSVIEYKIEIPTIELINPPKWYMQYEIPVLRSEFRITTPEDIDFGIKRYNCDYLDIADQKSEIALMPYSGRSYYANKYRFVKTNIPATSNRIDDASRIYIKFMLEYATRRHSLSGMEMLYKSVDPTFKYLNKAEKELVNDRVGMIIYTKPELTTLSKKLMKNSCFGPPMVINLGLKDTLNALIANTNNTLNKALLIYKFVKNTMEWDSSYRVYVNESPPFFVIRLLRYISPGLKLNTSLSKPLKKQSGTSSEINFILINLLNSSGIKAYPVLISTFNKEYIDTSFFNLHEFNHVVAYAEIDDKEFLFDAVKKGSGNILSEDGINPWGLLIKRDRAMWIAVSKD